MNQYSGVDQDEYKPWKVQPMVIFIIIVAVMAILLFSMVMTRNTGSIRPPVEQIRASLENDSRFIECFTNAEQSESQSDIEGVWFIDRSLSMKGYLVEYNVENSIEESQYVKTIELVRNMLPFRTFSVYGFARKIEFLSDEGANSALRKEFYNQDTTELSRCFQEITLWTNTNNSNQIYIITSDLLLSSDELDSEAKLIKSIKSCLYNDLDIAIVCLRSHYRGFITKYVIEGTQVSEERVESEVFDTRTLSNDAPYGNRKPFYIVLMSKSSQLIDEFCAELRNNQSTSEMQVFRPSISSTYDTPVLWRSNVSIDNEIPMEYDAGNIIFNDSNIPLLYLDWTERKLMYRNRISTVSLPYKAIISNGFRNLNELKFDVRPLANMKSNHSSPSVSALEDLVRDRLILTIDIPYSNNYGWDVYMVDIHDKKFISYSDLPEWISDWSIKEYKSNSDAVRTKGLSDFLFALTTNYTRNPKLGGFVVSIGR